MALPPLAEVWDLSAWVGQDIDPLDPRAGAVLSAASAIVRNYVGETWTDDAGALTDVPDLAAAVAVQVAARVWLNPAGLTSVTADDATRRWGESASFGLYLTTEDRDALDGLRSGSAATGLSTLSITRGEFSGGTVYVPTAPEPSGPPFPWYAEDDLS